MEFMLALSIPASLAIYTVLAIYNGHFRYANTFGVIYVISFFSFAFFLDVKAKEAWKTERVSAVIIADATVSRDGINYPIFIEKYRITTRLAASDTNTIFKKGDRITLNYTHYSSAR